VVSPICRNYMHELTDVSFLHNNQPRYSAPDLFVRTEMPAHGSSRCSMFSLPAREITHCNLKSRAIYYPLEKSKNMTLSPHLHADPRFTLYTSQRSFAKASRASGHIRIGGRSCAYPRFVYLNLKKIHQENVTKGRQRKQPQE